MARRLLGVVTGHPGHGFSDVPAWVEDPVRWITAEGYARGFPNGTYRPDANINRGEVTNMLWKIAGSPTGHPAHGLGDVPAWLTRRSTGPSATGVVRPYPNGTFRPNLAMPRRQVVAAAWPWTAAATGFPAHGLSDVPACLDAAVRWAVVHDYMAGFPDGRFRPERPDLPGPGHPHAVPHPRRRRRRC